MAKRNVFDLLVTEVLWAITGNGMASMVGVIDTSDPNATPSVEIFGLEPGDYRIELEATSEDGESTCRGSAMFDVTAGVATEVAVLLRCSTVQRFGAVRVNGYADTDAGLILLVGKIKKRPEVLMVINGHHAGKNAIRVELRIAAADAAVIRTIL